MKKTPLEWKKQRCKWNLSKHNAYCKSLRQMHWEQRMFFYTNVRIFLLYTCTTIQIQRVMTIVCMPLCWSFVRINIYSLFGFGWIYAYFPSIQLILWCKYVTSYKWEICNAMNKFYIWFGFMACTHCQNGKCVRQIECVRCERSWLNTVRHRLMPKYAARKEILNSSMQTVKRFIAFGACASHRSFRIPFAIRFLSMFMTSAQNQLHKSIHVFESRELQMWKYSEENRRAEKKKTIRRQAAMCLNMRREEKKTYRQTRFFVDKENFRQSFSFMPTHNVSCMCMCFWYTTNKIVS